MVYIFTFMMKDFHHFPGDSWQLTLNMNSEQHFPTLENNNLSNERDYPNTTGKLLLSYCTCPTLLYTQCILIDVLHILHAFLCLCV